MNTLSLFFSSLCVLGALVVNSSAATYPQWWADRHVLTNATVIDDYSALNAGQLKWMAKMAKAELDARLHGGAGPEISALVASFNNTNNYAPVNMGQLKNVTKRFYDRLIAVGYTHTYPWTATTADDNNYAIAAVGQLKYVFSWDLQAGALDLAGDGMSDEWERLYFGTLAVAPGGDEDGDGLTNLEEYTLGTDPTSPDTDGDWLPDGEEVLIYGTDPLVADSDEDGLPDGDEVSGETDPVGDDTDGDGLPDGWELSHGLDPLDPYDYPWAVPLGCETFFYVTPHDPGHRFGPNAKIVMHFPVCVNFVDAGYKHPVTGAQVDVTPVIDPATGNYVMEIPFEATVSNRLAAVARSDYFHEDEVTINYLSLPGYPSWGVSYTYNITVVSLDDSTETTIVPVGEGGVYSASFTAKTLPVGCAPLIGPYIWWSCEGGDPDEFDWEPEFTTDLVPGEYWVWALNGYNSEYLENYNLFRVGVVKADLVPDFNHDGKIDDTDRTELVARGPFRFWINDDDDSGYDGGDDVSLASGISQDWRDDSVFPGLGHYVVDGVKDLVDFFPVYVDVAQAVQVLPKESYRYFIKHEEGALNAVPTTYLRGYTDDAATQAGAYLTRVDVAERFVTSDLYLKQITAAGVEIPDDYLVDAETMGKGFVLLCEGRKTSQKPLVLEIRKRADSSVVYTKEMPLSLSGVEKMYRHLNLRSAGLFGGTDGRPTETYDPSNYPDRLCRNTDVVMLHGVNVGGTAARGWHAEMFKRLYWTGSTARFHGITYTADAGLTPANYQQNVYNALSASSNVSVYVTSLSGSRVVIAHSMGNVAVCNAIQDYDMPVNKYFMLDAAVAAETLKESTFNEATTNNVMLSPDWKLYQSRTWASKWHELFMTYTNDARSQLTWKNRFMNVASLGDKVCNLYSSEDQCLDIYGGVPGFWTGADLDLSWSGATLTVDHYVWHKQELFKGTEGFILGIGSTDWAGWEFRRNLLGFKVYSSEEANNTTITPDSVLRTTCVFRSNPSGMFNCVIPRPLQNEILAKGIPALSVPVGHDTLVLGELKNINMATPLYKPSDWPRSHPTYRQRWLHSDIRNMAYLYVNKAFQVFVDDGGL